MLLNSTVSTAAKYFNIGQNGGLFWAVDWEVYLKSVCHYRNITISKGHFGKGTTYTGQDWDRYSGYTNETG